eukprot:3453980-Lingulodinium_polyedra.AAC.1
MIPTRTRARTSPTVYEPSETQGATARVDARRHGRRPRDRPAKLLQSPPPCVGQKWLEPKWIQTPSLA